MHLSLHSSLQLGNALFWSCVNLIECNIINELIDRNIIHVEFNEAITNKMEVVRIAIDLLFLASSQFNKVCNFNIVVLI